MKYLWFKFSASLIRRGGIAFEGSGTVRLKLFTAPHRTRLSVIPLGSRMYHHEATGDSWVEMENWLQRMYSFLSKVPYPCGLILYSDGTLVGSGKIKLQPIYASITNLSTRDKNSREGKWYEFAVVLETFSL